jgi:hypothetical protein
MIPTVILVGLIFGRWWRIVIPLAAVGWALLLIVTGVDSGFLFSLGAAAIAIPNVALGVLVHQALWQLVRRVATATQPREVA